MDDYKTKYGIVVCENCYQIPKITILNKDKVRTYCRKCKETKIRDYSYFEKFMKNIEKESWTDLPKCTFDKNHDSQSLEYCFQCTKYLCKECISTHNTSLGDKNHIFIKQKIDNQYYCHKEGHNEFILYKYCTECNDYLCAQCKCEHENSEKIYDFQENKNKETINIIIEKVQDCLKIIEKEEKKLKIFLDKIEKRIREIKNKFEDYKEKNLRIISIYKLLLNNYINFNSIKNYNITNNIVINDNFDLSTSEFFIKEKDTPVNECFDAKYNKLYSFYTNKQHITTKEYIEHFITKKFCSKKSMKKCIIINEKLISFFFLNDNHIYIIRKNDMIEKLSFSNIIKDIYSLNSQLLIVTFINKSSILYNINNYKNETIRCNFIVPNLLTKDNVFIIDDNYKYAFLIYYRNKENYFLINKENRNCNFNYIFDNINTIITKSKIHLDEENKLKQIFGKKINITIETIMTLDYILMELIDNYTMNFFRNNENKFDENEMKEFLINTNYIYYIIGKKVDSNNLNIEENDKMKYLLNLIDCCHQIRKQYIKYIVINTKINNINNLKNEYLIFMGQQYLFVKYLIKEKEFIPITTPNYIANNENDFNNYEINNISQNYIILKNKKGKIINFINNNTFLVLNRQYKYYSNIISNNKYLLFDNIKDNYYMFSLIDLSNLSKVEDNNLLKLLNIKLDNIIPKSLMTNDFKTFVILYDNNQLCIDNYILNKAIDNIDNSNNIKKINIKKTKKP